MFGKRGALELSINAIVIIVLAMTLLGLGLMFIRSQFGKISETGLQVQDQIKEQILEDLRTGDKRLSFPSSEITMGRGESKTLAVGVKNTLDGPLEFKIKMHDLSDLGCDTVIARSRTSSATCAGFFWNTNSQTLASGEAKVEPIMIFAPKTSGTYLYKIEITNERSTGSSQEYFSKTFFVKVV